MTLRELARLTNYSVSTVSKAFHDAPDVSKETKEEILRIAKEQGCYLKYHREKYQKKIVALICPELRSDFYASAIERLQSMIERDGGLALISTDRFSRTARNELLEYYASYLAVDGILVFGLETPPKKGFDIPIVSLLGNRNLHVDHVYVDTESSILDAVSHLASLGHHHIGFIGESLTDTKEVAFRRAMARCGLPVDEKAMIVSSSRFEKAGEEGASRLLAAAPETTAVIAAYDYIAAGAIKHFGDRGLRVPDDISVIGMDDITASSYMEKPLTSISFGTTEAMEIAWDLLKEKMEKRHYTVLRQIAVAGKLMIRKTTAPPRSN
ncbi:MAG: LacI family transcriptional regulator [Ruminococcaceae bacterium]|nr:LacI family transcriptional regulator [Oscillospiraceae bacterium]